MLGDLGANSSSRIRNRKQGKFAIASGINCQFPARRRFHRLYRISDQVKCYLLNLDLVDDDVGKLTIAAERNTNPLLSRPYQGKGGRLLH